MLKFRRRNIWHPKLSWRCILVFASKSRVMLQFNYFQLHCTFIAPNNCIPVATVQTSHSNGFSTKSNKGVTLRMSLKRAVNSDFNISKDCSKSSFLTKDGSSCAAFNSAGKWVKFDCCSWVMNKSSFASNTFISLIRVGNIWYRPCNFRLSLLRWSVMSVRNAILAGVPAVTSD